MLSTTELISSSAAFPMPTFYRLHYAPPNFCMYIVYSYRQGKTVKCRLNCYTMVKFEITEFLYSHIIRNTVMNEFFGKNRADDLFLIQIRLFRLAQAKWKVDEEKCSSIFNKYKVYDYIGTCYDFFHIQGDDANLLDIESYLVNNGAEI